MLVSTGPYIRGGVIFDGGLYSGFLPLFIQVVSRVERGESRRTAKQKLMHKLFVFQLSLNCFEIWPCVCGTYSRHTCRTICFILSIFYIF